MTSETKDKIKAGLNTESNPADKLKELFVDVVQENRIKFGQQPARRPVFLKPHGVAHGIFKINIDLPKDLKVGIFALTEFPAWVRFSSDTRPELTDLKSTCGIAIKLFGVSGLKLLDDGDTQDFILQNHDVFFVDTAQDMADFTEAGVAYDNYPAYLAKHPKTDEILKEMAKIETSSLTATYWSALPYAFGKNRYVKYKLVPANGNLQQHAQDDDYLAKDLQRRLINGPASFKFMIQFQKDEKSMPLDKATVCWDESLSAPIHIATLTLPKQDIVEKGQAEYGENLSFNPWHCLPEHKPEGSISLARKSVYAASANNRRGANGVSQDEPKCPRYFCQQDSGKDTLIVSAAIHPAIGIGRVGNSESEYFFGPEVIEPIAQQPGYYRDKNGAMKRQVAKFRVYGLNAKGEVVKELDSNNAEIEWGVHLVNKKSSWYQFQIALDLDIPEISLVAPSLLRNTHIADRSKLVIDPGPKNISGKDAKKLEFIGKFMDVPVYLGEIFTDSKGRLIVLGGRGKSASVDNVRAITFANNEGWYDDISDGPITATVKIDGVALDVASAWVVIRPPNYAPMQKSVRTMWDLIRDVAYKDKDNKLKLTRPERPSFKNEIQPIFERLANLQWVNAGFAEAFGWNAPFNFTSKAWMRKLSDTSSAMQGLRTVLMKQFRINDRDGISPIPMPWLYGDAMNVPPVASAKQYSTLSDLQMELLQLWADGNFIDDYNPDAKPITAIEELPVEMQPEMLDRASLEFCVADAFHPGCEMTWPMRNPKMYMSPFRIKHAPKGAKEPFYGPMLDSDLVAARGGPLSVGQFAGGITRWMAVPWQTDTASCRSGYDNTYYKPYLPAFWPARVPNQILTKKNYDIVCNPHEQIEDRLQAFANRADWMGSLVGDPITKINLMIENFANLPFIELLPGLKNDPNFPPLMQVAEDSSQDKKLLKTMTGFLGDLPNSAVDQQANADEGMSNIDKVKRFRRLDDL